MRNKIEAIALFVLALTPAQVFAQFSGGAGIEAPPAAVEAPATAPAAPGNGWRLDDEQSPSQLAFESPDRNGEPDLLLACDGVNGEVNILYRRLASDDAEQRADKNGGLDAEINGGGRSISVRGYVARAPEATAIGYTILHTENIAAILSAPDLRLTLPGMTIETAPGDAVARLLSRCPPLSTVYESMAWRRRINLQAGFAVDLPVGLFRLASADRFGRFYRDGPGRGTLQVSAIVNQDDLTPRDALAKFTRDPDIVTRVSRSAAHGNAFTLAGTRGDRHVFLKALLTCDRATWAIVRVEYDAQARREYEPIVTRLDQSFTAQGAVDGLKPCE